MRFHYKRVKNIGWITMVNPPANALVHPVFADKEELLSFFEDTALKAVILRGEGRHFCSGADPDSFIDIFRDTRSLHRALDNAKELLQILSFAPIPVAAVISGSCLGAGLEIALACHFRFAAKSAMFGFPECGHALMPGMGGTIMSRQLIAQRYVIDLVLSGRMIGAEEARQIRLIDVVGAGKKIEDEAIRFLESLTSSHPPKLIRAVMRSIHNGRQMSTEAALAEETRLFCELAQDVVASESQRKTSAP